MLPSKLGVAHALGVPLEVIGLGAKLVEHSGIVGLDGLLRSDRVPIFPLSSTRFFLWTLIQILGWLHRSGRVCEPSPTVLARTGTRFFAAADADAALN